MIETSIGRLGDCLESVSENCFMFFRTENTFGKECTIVLSVLHVFKNPVFRE